MFILIFLILIVVGCRNEPCGFFLVFCLLERWPHVVFDVCGVWYSTPGTTHAQIIEDRR